MSTVPPRAPFPAGWPLGQSILSGVLVLSITAVAVAVLPQQTGVVDLLSQPSLRIDGATADDLAGASVAGAGDVNGDGIGDVIVGAPGRGPVAAGAAYVLFGSETPTNVDLGALGRDGFRMSGAVDFENAGTAVAPAGDVNGDGLGDVLVGAPGSGNNGRFGSGTAYVVFGQTTAVNIDLGALGGAGFRIDGANAIDGAGDSVAAAGDLNGDGLADVLVGAPNADPNGTNSGSAYVVFGRRASTSVDLAALTGKGFRMDGGAEFDLAGASVAPAGDVNRDGLPDVLVGAPETDNRSRLSSGSVYVVFGQEVSSNIALGALGRGGFRIDGAAASDRAGSSVASAGDVDLDGRVDVLVGAPAADNNGRASSGSAYVVFGQQAPTDVDLAALGSSGVRFDGADAVGGAGTSVAGAGDLNGDGFPDVLVGAPGDDHTGRRAGTAYGIIGKTAPTNIDLASLQAGLRIDGAEGNTGDSVAGPGDVNGDGRPDILIGAPFANNNDLDRSGSAYVVYGFGEPELSYPVADGAVGQQLTVLPATLRRTGTASFSVRPPLPTGLTLNANTGKVSGIPTVAVVPRGLFVVTMSDLVGSTSALLNLQIEP